MRLSKSGGDSLICTLILFRYNQILDHSADEAEADFERRDSTSGPAEDSGSLASPTVPGIAKDLQSSSKKSGKRVGIPGLTKYIFIRDGGGLMSQVTFKVYNEETGEMQYVARKKKMRSPHIYMYKVKGHKNQSAKELKNSEKLEAVLMASSDLIEYRLVIDDKGQQEIAGAAFDKTNIFNEMVHGFQPRRLSAVVPLFANGAPIPHDISGGQTSLVQHLRLKDVESNPSLVVLRTKEPVFQDGCYRLNFYGRASVPSVKNFQVCWAAFYCFDLILISLSIPEISTTYSANSESLGTMSSILISRSLFLSCRLLLLPSVSSAMCDDLQQ